MYTDYISNIYSLVLTIRGKHMATREDQLLDPFNKGNGKRPPGLYDYTVLQRFIISGSWSGTLVSQAAIVWFPNVAVDAIFLMYRFGDAGSAIGAITNIYGGAATLNTSAQGRLLLIQNQGQYIKLGGPAYTNYAKGRAVTGGLNVFSSVVPVGATVISGTIAAAAIPAYSGIANSALLETSSDFDKDTVPILPLATGVTVVQGPDLAPQMRGVGYMDNATAGAGGSGSTYSGTAPTDAEESRILTVNTNILSTSAFFVSDSGWTIVGANYTNYDLGITAGQGGLSTSISPVSRQSFIVSLDLGVDGTASAFTTVIVHFNHLYGSWNPNLGGVEVYSVQQQYTVTSVFNNLQRALPTIITPIPSSAEARSMPKLNVIGTYGELAQYIGTQFWVEFRPSNSSSIAPVLRSVGYRVSSGHESTRMVWYEGATNQTITISGAVTWQAVPRPNTLFLRQTVSNAKQEYYSSEETIAAAEKYGDPTNAKYRKCYPSDIYKALVTQGDATRDEGENTGKRQRLV